MYVCIQTYNILPDTSSSRWRSHGCDTSDTWNDGTTDLQLIADILSSLSSTCSDCVLVAVCGWDGIQQGQLCCWVSLEAWCFLVWPDDSKNPSKWDWLPWLTQLDRYLNMNQFVGAAFAALAWAFFENFVLYPIISPTNHHNITVEWPGVISFFGWTFAEQFQPRSPCAQYVGNAFALLSLRCPSCDSTTSFARCVCFPRWIEMSWNLCFKRF
jgi:hypothetical protein